jgi:hypothetical protein
MLQLLVPANVVPSSLILFTDGGDIFLWNVGSHQEPHSVIPEDGILHHTHMLKCVQRYTWNLCKRYYFI